jgi:hypothetical protein
MKAFTVKEISKNISGYKYEVEDYWSPFPAIENDTTFPTTVALFTSEEELIRWIRSRLTT